MKTKEESRDKRRASIRKRVHGTAERPRLAVFRSLNHIYAQVVNDTDRKTLAAFSTLDKELRASLSQGTRVKKKDQATKVGEAIAKRLLSQGIDKVVFDRGGYLYHGRVSALADGARKAGLKF